MNNQNADSILKFNTRLGHVVINQSKITAAGQGLFAKKQIRISQPVVVYYGSKITDEQVYDVYINNHEEYIEMSAFIRGTLNGFNILGDKNNNVDVLQGVYVNDIARIDCKKNQVNKQILHDYATTYKKCNLKVVDTADYPIYYATRTIKKGEELYVHYGIGYWLLHIGYLPQEISELNDIYNFESFYTNTNVNTK